MSKYDPKKKLELFLELKRKTLKRIKDLEEKFKEEKENEEAWPGHESNFLQQLEEDYSTALTHLKEIEETLQKLKQEISSRSQKR